MKSEQDYTQLTLEELQKAEKNINRQVITLSVMIGFLFGIMIFGVVANGFGLVYILIPILLIAAFTKRSKTLNKELTAIREEMSYQSALDKNKQ